MGEHLNYGVGPAGASFSEWRIAIGARVSKQSIQWGVEATR